MTRRMAIALVAVAGVWSLIGCSSLTVPLPCDLMIVAVAADSTLKEGDPVPPEPQVIAGPGEFDAIGSSIKTDPNGGVSLELRLRGAAIERLAAHTAAHLGEPIAIVINGELSLLNEFSQTGPVSTLPSESEGVLPPYAG